MATNDEILASLAKLEKSSRLAIPLSLVAFVAIMAMIFLSARELAQTRRQIDEAKLELDKVVKETQERLQTADRKIEQAAANQGKPGWAADLQAARVDIAVADAKLTRTQVQMTKQSGAPATVRPSYGYGATSVDIFYCESSGEAARQLAEKLVALKGTDPGRWRVKMLPNTVNATEGYRISNNVIRHNPDEAGIAKTLVADAGKLGVNFRMMEIAYPTPNYISAFVCTPTQSAQRASSSQRAPSSQQAPAAQSATQPAQPASTGERGGNESGGFTFTFGFGGGSKGGGYQSGH